MKVFNWRQVAPNLVTIMAMLAGFISILLTIEGLGETSIEKPFRLAASLIMLAMILDGLDGNLARWLKGESEFGAELDTYVDLMAFGIAPAILVFAVTLGNKDLPWRILLPSAVALSGMVRLARFKVKDPLRGQGGYAGLPITANAGWVSLMVFISQTPPTAGVKEDFFSLQHGWFALVFVVGVFVFILLQVSSFRYPKPTKKAGLFSICVFLVGMLFYPEKQLSVKVAVVILVLGIGYAVFGPLFVKGVEVHKARKESKANGKEV